MAKPTPDETSRAGAATGSDALAPTSTPTPTLAPTSPRAALAAELAAHVARLLAAGDLAGARIAHEAMGRLLAAPPERTVEVVDLDVERRKRGER